MLIFKDYSNYYRRKKLSKFDYFLLVFKAMLFFEDSTDMKAFLIQLGVLKGSALVPAIKRRIANMYFLECLGWLVNYLHEYYRAENEEQRHRNAIVIVRYVLDSIISHNEFSLRCFTLEPKVTSILGVCSSILNIYLVWK